MNIASLTTKPSRVWRFFRAGGFDQVSLDNGADLLALDQLDQKLWVALACPASGIEFDTRTLELIDTDKDGRVRAPELIAALKWAGGLLKNPDDLTRHAPRLALSAINDTTEEGQGILNSARQILANLGKADTKDIGLEETSDTSKILAQTAFNGDGVIVAESAADDATRALIGDIVASVGAVADRSGKSGISQAKVDQFFAEAAAYEAWVAKGEKEAATVLPLGAGTAAAAAAFVAVRTKVNDYFGRCRLAAFDQRALAALNGEEKEFLALAAKDLTITAAEITNFPLAQVAASKPLPLKSGVNPAWAEALGTFLSAAVTPLLGDRGQITEAEWATISAKLTPYLDWQVAKPATGVAGLDLARLRAILAGKGKATLAELLAKDQGEASKVAAIAAVDKLVRFHRDLHLLCVNFVNFKDFYDRGEPAVFQAGTLYLDQRSCQLCLRVDDAGKHAAMAGLAGTYLAYCDCVRRGSGEKMQIVAAFTNGDADNLMVGRNGIFYDRKGRDWDATITKIIDNPISIRQAFWAPYKKLVRMIEEQVAKRAAAADAAADAKLAAAANTAANVDKAKTEPKKIDVGTVAAMGVAFGAIGALITTLIGQAAGLFKLPFWQLCLAVVGLLLVISGPSMLIAWLKLRKRNLGPILDANGWAVNARAKINVPFGTSLTGIAKLPPGAQAAPTDDPFAERPAVWPKPLAVVIVICFLYSLLNSQGLIWKWTGGKLGQSTEEVERAKAKKDTLATPAGATNAPPAQ